jgi:hypothetical protein
MGGTAMSTPRPDPYLKEYLKLRGKILVDVVKDDDGINGEPVYGLVFKSGVKDRKPSVAWVYRDEEGNGAGFLNITEVDLGTRSISVEGV